jgi:adenine phosphoribosyltransferase
MSSDHEELSRHIRDVPDFPKEGIIFKDITPMLQNPKTFQLSVDMLAERYMGKGIDVVLGAEARGFIVAAALAYKMGAGFVPARKPGKLPWETEHVAYDLEYGTDGLEVHRDAITSGASVLIVDDLLATGGTAEACVKLVEGLGGVVKGFSFFIELTFLNGRERLSNVPIHSLIQY